MYKDLGMTIVPFGKYKGKIISDIPSGYLKWLAENAYIDEIAEAADAEYDFRDANNEHFWED